MVTQSSKAWKDKFLSRPTLKMPPAPPCMENTLMGTLGIPQFPRGPLKNTPAHTVLSQQSFLTAQNLKV